MAEVLTRAGGKLGDSGGESPIGTGGFDFPGLRVEAAGARHHEEFR
jgi:hypothetical protein